MATSVLYMLSRSSKIICSSLLGRHSVVSLNNGIRVFCSTGTITPDPTSTEDSETDILDPEMEKSKAISKAMKAYLKRTREHEEFMKAQIAEFEAGKRHLANIMGQDPDTITQDDIDKAIEYLFPAGLYEKKARPMLKHPYELYPVRKAAEFDESGRPYHYLFYTRHPHFFSILHETVARLKGLEQMEDEANSGATSSELPEELDLTGSSLLSKEEMEILITEFIFENQYENFKEVMERFIQHPYAYTQKDFIMKYRKELGAKGKFIHVEKPKYDETGRAYMDASTARKTSKADVIVRVPGTGEITINETDISYFKQLQPREQILFPLQFTNMINKVDVEATAKSGGISSQAGAIRLGIAKCLLPFVDETMIERMRLAGLLQRDFRKRERKKTGQWKARKKFTWRKR